jgi:hypothetical protein
MREVNELAIETLARDLPDIEVGMIQGQAK